MAEQSKILLVIRCLVKRKDKILLLQRTRKTWWNPDRWEFPGGKVDLGQDVTNALEREVLEEASLLIKVVSPLVYFESYVASGMKKKEYNGVPVVHIVGRGALIGGTPRLSDEHKNYTWVTPKQALKMDLTLDCKKALIALT